MVSVSKTSRYQERSLLGGVAPSAVLQISDRNGYPALLTRTSSRSPDHPRNSRNSSCTLSCLETSAAIPVARTPECRAISAAAPSESSRPRVATAMLHPATAKAEDMDRPELSLQTVMNKIC